MEILLLVQENPASIHLLGSLVPPEADPSSVWRPGRATEHAACPLASQTRAAALGGWSCARLPTLPGTLAASLLPGRLWGKAARPVPACVSPRRSPRSRASARSRAPARGCGSGAGRITLPALCRYPLETGLRREAREAPAVVNVGSAHSRRGLSHGGWRWGSEKNAASRATAQSVEKQQATFPFLHRNACQAKEARAAPLPVPSPRRLRRLWRMKSLAKVVFLFRWP
ncbi:uncharacterized protein LOC106009450 [Heterocephalus glaber]|uniref:Uncharacterized protein LOC106009450 n=1 Tax=Heterocephalus glaber TaxID=10181 RepID=A0AAX6QVV3_HETGA|nr:uncharacterized protein LOC106009450 [Heterocephalus glaber]